MSTPLPGALGAPPARATWFRSPVALLLAVSAVLVAAIFVATNVIADDAARDAARAQAESVSELLAQTTAEPYVAAGLLSGKPGAYDKFFRKAPNLLQARDVDSVDLFAPDGTLVYSQDDPDAVPIISRERYALSSAQQRVLREGGTGSELADPASPRSLDRAGDERGLVKIFTRIETETGEPVLFVAYWALDGLEEGRSEIFGAFRWITLGPLVLLSLISAVMLGLLTTQVRRAGRERERLLEAAMTASDAERRRIARDLHDGVVQDLAGTAFSLSAVSRDLEVPPHLRGRLAGAGDSLRDGLRSLRSLLAEIHPPDLHGKGLASAVADLLAPVSAAGITASASVEDVEDAPAAEVAMLWRVTQEAVRNTVRHAEASTLAVTVRGTGSGSLLEVVDDGIGFDQACHRGPEHFGLTGLRSLVADAGGRLEVRSAPGEGTIVRLEVRR
ncbi:sensor histidine kinase [Nocardioides salarius]|uniref:sensor histidine kinase n=1 Tax=Nocardioides salarius TaxID=374513 RepID=UPI0030FC2DB8